MGAVTQFGIASSQKLSQIEFYSIRFSSLFLLSSILLFVSWFSVSTVIWIWFFSTIRYVLESVFQEEFSSREYVLAKNRIVFSSSVEFRFCQVSFITLLIETLNGRQSPCWTIKELKQVKYIKATNNGEHNFCNFYILTNKIRRF